MSMVNGGTSQNSAIPLAAGALLIISGVLGLLTWVIVAFFSAIIGGAVSMIPAGGAEDFLAGIFILCGVIGLIFSIMTLLGGIMAIQRKKWGIALSGSILGLLIIGPYFVSSILALVGLILVIVSKQEFDGSNKPTKAAEMDRRCPNCGRSIPMDARACPYCAKKFEQ